jgi:chromate transporter
LRDIFLLYLQVGTVSFGGGLVALVYREVVERRRWLGKSEFLSGLTLSQVLPGINMPNLAVYIGARMRGVAGATVGLVGLLLVPFFAILAVAGMYSYIEGNLSVQAFMDGMATTAVGLFVSVGAKALRGNPVELIPTVIMVTIVVTVGLLRLPLIPVILGVAPISVALAWRKGNGHA